MVYILLAFINQASTVEVPICSSCKGEVSRKGFRKAREWDECCRHPRASMLVMHTWAEDLTKRSIVDNGASQSPQSLSWTRVGGLLAEPQFALLISRPSSVVRSARTYDSGSSCFMSESFLYYGCR